MAGDDRWRHDDRYRGEDERYRFESNRRYETGDHRDGTRRREADETFGRGSHDYPAGSFGRNHRGDRPRDDDRSGNPYGGGRERDYGPGDDHRFGRSEGRYRDEDRRSATEMAFGRSGSESRDYRPGDYSRNYDRDHRGLLERAGDEITSWFGHDDGGHQRPHGDEGHGNHRGRGPKSYQRSDDRIRDDLNDRLTDDHRLDASEIEVAVEAREVTLSGLVQSRQDKRRAEDIADSVSGVTHVQNNLRVHNAGGAWSSHQQRGGTGTRNAPTGAAGSTTTDPQGLSEPDEGGLGAKIP